jgi:23S rRNA (guanine745-N1)-methyltransferase
MLSPRNGAEFERMLAPGGALIVVTATRRHLGELVRTLGLLSVDARKRERLESSLGSVLQVVDRSLCELSLSLGHEDVRALASMGPSAHHIDAATLTDRIRALPRRVTVTVSVDLAVYRAAR